MSASHDHHGSGFELSQPLFAPPPASLDGTGAYVAPTDLEQDPEAYFEEALPPQSIPSLEELLSQSATPSGVFPPHRSASQAEGANAPSEVEEDDGYYGDDEAETKPETQPLFGTPVVRAEEATAGHDFLGSPLVLHYSPTPPPAYSGSSSPVSFGSGDLEGKVEEEEEEGDASSQHTLILGRQTPPEPVAEEEEEEAATAATDENNAAPANVVPTAPAIIAKNHKKDDENKTHLSNSHLAVLYAGHWEYRELYNKNVLALNTNNLNNDFTDISFKGVDLNGKKIGGNLTNAYIDCRFIQGAEFLAGIIISPTTKFAFAKDPYTGRTNITKEQLQQLGEKACLANTDLSELYRSIAGVRGQKRRAAQLKPDATQSLITNFFQQPPQRRRLVAQAVQAAGAAHPALVPALRG